MAEKNEDVLKFDIAVDIRKSLKAMEKFQRQMAKSMKAMTKAGNKMGKDSEKASKGATKATKDWQESLLGVEDSFEGVDAAADDLTKTIQLLQKEVKHLSGEEKKGLQATIEGLKKAREERKRLTGNKEPPKGGLFFGRFTPEKVAKELKAAGEALVEPLKEFLNRNLKGVVESSFKGAGAVLSRSLKFGKIMNEMGTTALHKRAEQMSIKGQGTGGNKGKALEAGGAGLKQVANMMGKLGSMMQLLSTLGPVLETAGGAIVGIIKLFIDADALVKDFNRGILESASNLEFLENAGGKAELAIANMDDALKGVRDAAMDHAFNNALGITKDTTMATVAALEQEGVAFGTLAKEAGGTAEGMKELTQEIVKTGVAYSRSLGVPLNEITSLQAEMALEMGTTVRQTAGEFTKLARAAAGSGIAGNKFFNTIKGASADLSLWNLRLDGAIDLLGKLGKIMSPRGAQQFFQSISSGFKNMGRQDLLKQTLLAGVDNVRKVLKEEVGDQQKELAQQIMDLGGAAGQSLEEVMGTIQKEGYEGADRLIRGVKDATKIGTLREKAAEIERKKQGAEGDTYEVSQASREIRDPAHQIDIMMSELQKFGGNLLKPNKLALQATAETANMSAEQVAQLHSLALAVDAQRKILIRNAKNDPKLTAQQLAKRLKEIDEMSTKQVLASDESLKAQADSLAKDEDKKQASVQDAIQDMSKEQGQRTQKLTDKLDNLVDWFMNQFYGVMLDIWEAVDSIVHPMQTMERNTKRAVLETKSSAVKQAYANTGGNPDTFKANLLANNSEFSKRFDTRLGNASKPNAKEEDVLLAQTIAKKIDEALGDDVDKMVDVAKNAGFNDTQVEMVRRNANKGMTFSQAVSHSGVERDHQEEALWKSLQKIDPDKLVYLGNLLEALPDTPAGAPATPAAAPVAGPASPVQATADATAETNDHLATAAQNDKKQQQIMTQQGVKIDPQTVKDQNKGVGDSMLAALRTALFEFYLYSGTDRGTMITAMKAGGVMNGNALAQIFTQGALGNGGTLGGVAGVSQANQAPGNAAGGMVTGISNGMAVVAARGEGLASVGRGERIVPAGGGSGVHVTVNGIGGNELARYIEAKVIEGIREYKRRERFY